MDFDQGRIIRAAPATAIIFSIVFSPLLLVGATCIAKTGQTWGGLFFCMLYPSAIYAICSPTVLLVGTMLTYRNLFGSRSIDLSSVTKASVSAQPTPTLQLHAVNSRRPFTFIIKPFSKAGITCIMQHIRASSPGVRFDRISADLLHADFTSVTREAISTRNLIRVALTVGGASAAAALARALIH